MNYCKEIYQTVDWASIKDFVLVLLSAIAIFSSYLQHKRTKRAEWIKDFRLIIAKLISTITTQTDENNVDYHKEIFEQLSLVTLYLDEKNPLHSSFYDSLAKMRSDIKDFEKGDKDSFQTSVTITELILTAKKIIQQENNKMF